MSQHIETKVEMPSQSSPLYVSGVKLAVLVVAFEFVSLLMLLDTMIVRTLSPTSNPRKCLLTAGFTKLTRRFIAPRVVSIPQYMFHSMQVYTISEGLLRTESFT